MLLRDKHGTTVKTGERQIGLGNSKTWSITWCEELQVRREIFSSSH